MARIVVFSFLFLFLTLRPTHEVGATSFRELAPEIRYQQAEFICAAESLGPKNVSNKVFSSSTLTAFKILDCAKGRLVTSEILILWPGNTHSTHRVRIAGVTPAPAPKTLLIISFSSTEIEDTYSLVDWRPQELQKDADGNFFIKEIPHLSPSRRASQRTSDEELGEKLIPSESKGRSWEEYKQEVQQSVEDKKRKNRKNQ